MKNKKNILQYTSQSKHKKKALWQKIWNFIWYEDSLLSWLVNVVLAFILVKFIIYPGLGLVLSTQFPVVAVVSTSMEHNSNFEQWWRVKGGWYQEQNVTAANFESFKNGFNKGDIMVLVGKDPQHLEVGDVIVYSTNNKEKNPIIHRIVEKKMNEEGYVFQTKGDNNSGQLGFEKEINAGQIIGKAVLRVPYLGWVKIIFTEVVQEVQHALL